MGTILGTVRSQDGTPIPNATVFLTGNSPDHRDMAALTDEGGSFRLTNLQPGSFEIQVNAQGRGGRTTSVQVEAAGTTEIEIQL
jgi:protocatechuate 3,4-dioxygenase beta subunit